MRGLTDFQITAREELEDRLARTAGTMDLRMIEGREEVYLVSEDGPVKLWIYEDGAEVSTPEEEFRLERYDFDTLHALMEEFIERAALEIGRWAGPAPHNGG